VLDQDERFLGVLTRGALLRDYASNSASPVSGALLRAPLTVHPQDTLRLVAQRFAEHSISCAPVVDPSTPHRVLGLITVENLLHARLRDLHEEHRRERVLRARPTRIRDTSPMETSA
jgi:CBS domain-containing protein